MNHILLVAAGGAAGAVSRMGLSRFIQNLFPSSMPYGTISVNLIGCLLIGAVWAVMQRTQLSPSLIALVLSGYIASFTTFSTFSLETVELVRSNQLGLALGNVAISNIGGLAAVVLGYVIVKSVSDLSSPGL